MSAPTKTERRVLDTLAAGGTVAAMGCSSGVSRTAYLYAADSTLVATMRTSTLNAMVERTLLVHAWQPSGSYDAGWLLPTHPRAGWA